MTSKRRKQTRNLRLAGTRWPDVHNQMVALLKNAGLQTAQFRKTLAIYNQRVSTK